MRHRRRRGEGRCCGSRPWRRCRGDRVEQRTRRQKPLFPEPRSRRGRSRQSARGQLRRVDKAVPRGRGLGGGAQRDGAEDEALRLGQHRAFVHDHRRPHARILSSAIRDQPCARIRHNRPASGGAARGCADRRAACRICPGHARRDLRGRPREGAGGRERVVAVDRGVAVGEPRRDDRGYAQFVGEPGAVVAYRHSLRVEWRA